ncbi:hypothetical protein PACTADRAFT_49117 [Pachysolen tannophilus NRRL Y-2460]|uniref:ferric-chelate reductase (NADPH) n=1 Tax=Pachysolen tannophilus NRRL Y-2460 TaxID=669874 RepID=A0A1E4U0E9_PACTA|nr:hypothetical protein PACTADRAFT_49117 [Pachysolen tannophilus NRRL Y-2460]
MKRFYNSENGTRSFSEALKCILVTVLLFSGVVRSEAKLDIPGVILVYACEAACEDYLFGVDATTDYYTEICTYPPAVGTILYCINNYTDSETWIKEAYTSMIQTCEGVYEYNDTSLEEVYENATEYIESYTDIANISTDTIYTPLTVDMTYVDEVFKGYSGMYDNYDMSQYFGALVICYWGFVMLIASLFNLAKRIGIAEKLHGKYINFIRKNITIPSVCEKHTKFVGGNIKFLKMFSAMFPMRVDIVILTGYLIITIVILAVRYRYDPYNVIESTHGLQVARLLADRAGIIAICHVPLIIVFGTRNNLLLLVTGFTQSNFILFHKWIGRVMFFNAVIHGCAYTNYCIVYGSYADSDTHDTYFRYGMTALVAAGLIMAQSFHFWRRYTYEIFLYGHIILSAVFIVGCWHHCSILGWMSWIYSAIALWALDGFLRLVRVLCFGFPKARIEAISDDTLKITVNRPKTSFFWSPSPGQFVYVYFLRPTMFWESHPFTITESIMNEKELLFFVKAKKGATKRLYNYISKKEGKLDLNTRISMEGPYGDSAPISNYDNIILYAGGNGITSPFDHAFKLSRKEGKQNQFIKLYWVVQNLEAMEWFYEQLSLLKDTKVSIEVYLTRMVELPTTSESKSITSTSDDNDKDKVNNEKVKSKECSDSDNDVLAEQSINYLKMYQDLSSFVTFKLGRPDMASLMEKDFAEYHGSKAVLACGPPDLCDIIRKLTALNLDKSDGRVDLFEELQIW